MRVILEVEDHDNKSRVVDTANNLLLNNCIEANEVEIRFGNVSRFVRTFHDTEQIRKFIYPEYKEA